jgi:hypothetical protein
MDWRTRIAAIVLAGGSVAGCASAADPGDAGMPDAAPRSSLEPSIEVLDAGVVRPTPRVIVNVLPEGLPAAQKPRVRIPVCNANPDPCCRFPDAPECHLPE